MKYKNIKNIIFDLGGVLLDIDYFKTIEAFEQLGISDFQEKYSQAKQTELFDLLETGKIEPTEFVGALKKHLKATVHDEKIIQAWNALLLNFWTDRLHLLQQIKNIYRTFLLSNTNIIHYNEYSNTLVKATGYSTLDSYFEKVYYSHIIGMRKPDKEIFQFVLQENKLQPHETLFIDDSIQHIESAKNLSIQTHWLQKNENLLDLFYE